MKIKSKIDVITNSSSECFTLRTDKSIEEVYNWLKENIKWAWEDKHNNEFPFTEPEIMEKGTGIIEWLVDYRDLWDSHDLNDVENYEIQYCLNYAVRNWWGDNSDFIIKSNGIAVRNYWIKFCENNIDELLTYFPEDFTEENFWERFDQQEDYYNTFLFPCDSYTDKYNPFLQKFIAWYKENHSTVIPKWWSIPEHLDVQYWKGKIGFSTTSENSISFEDMEKICKEFNGNHWHMG